MNDLTKQGIDALKAKDKARARELLSRSVQQNQQDIDAWLALSFAVDTSEEQITCLHQVLQFDPNNKFAQSQLVKLTKQSIVRTDSMPLRETALSKVPPLSATEPGLAIPDIQGQVESEAEIRGDTIPDAHRPRGIHNLVFESLRRLFSPPYLHSTLVIIASLTIITDVCLVLTGQPAAYWSDHSQANAGMQWLQWMLVTGPWLFVVFALVYVAVVSLTMSLFSRRIALVLWTIVVFLHLPDALSWLIRSLQRMVIFDSAYTGTLYMVVLIPLSSMLGIALSHALPNSTDSRANAIPLRKLSPVAVGLGSIWILFLIFGVVFAAHLPDRGWNPIKPQHHPSARIDGKVAYDINRGRAVLFGGGGAWTGRDWSYQSDTWEWDGTDWLQCFPQTSPAGRVSHAMAYDQARGVVVLFGGSNQQGAWGDTWEWDGKEWQRRSPTSNPPARGGHQMIYDTQRNKIVIYGGYDGIDTFFDDAWEWDGQEWHLISFESSPIASGFSMEYDQANHRALAFLVGSPTGTWIWEENRWSKLSLQVEPTERSNTSLVYDPIHQRFLLFGGYQKEQILGDTWVFDEQGWRCVRTSLNPAVRWGQSAFYDYQRKQIVIFGGSDQNTLLDDMWAFSAPKKIPACQ